MYQIEFDPATQKPLRRLDHSVRQRILDRLEWLAINFDETKAERLGGEWGGLFKLRVGDYRVAYRLKPNQNVIQVMAVGHRRDVYKR